MLKFYSIGHPLCHPGYNFGAGGSSSKSTSTQQQTAYSGINDPYTVDAIKTLIGAGGMTPQLAGQYADRTAMKNVALEAAGHYTKDAAFSDAKGSIDQLVRQQNEANKPVISRAVEGAGTSGGSMAALLSNDLATRTSQAGATLGAQLAASYGNIQANDLGTAANLSNIDPSAVTALLNAISGMQVSNSQGTAASKSSSVAANMSIIGG